MSCPKHAAARRWLIALGLDSPESTDTEVERHTFKMGTQLTTTVEAFGARLREELNGCETFIIIEMNARHMHANVQLEMGDEVLSFVVNKEEDMQHHEPEGV